MLIFGTVFNTPTYNGERYFLTVVDYFSRGTWAFLMHSKLDVFRLFKHFFDLVITQFYALVKYIRTDNAADFLNVIVNIFSLLMV